MKESVGDSSEGIRGHFTANGIVIDALARITPLNCFCVESDKIYN